MAGPLEIPENKVTVLQGHHSEVFICQWNPRNPLQLASGSGDSTARIWSLAPAAPNAALDPMATDSPSPPSLELRHFTSTQEKSKDVTTLDWSVRC